MTNSKDTSKVVDEWREKLGEAYAEIQVLSNHNRMLELSAGSYRSNEKRYKDEVIDLQTRLLGSQDRVTELQRQLLAMRAAAEGKQ